MDIERGTFKAKPQIQIPVKKNADEFHCIKVKALEVGGGERYKQIQKINKAGKTYICIIYDKRLI